MTNRHNMPMISAFACPANLARVVKAAAFWCNQLIFLLPAFPPATFTSGPLFSLQEDPWQIESTPHLLRPQ